jgi:ABC-type multidrug transport system permease subunit
MNSQGNTNLKEIPTFLIFIQLWMLFLVILNITCLWCINFARCYICCSELLANYVNAIFYLWLWEALHGEFNILYAALGMVSAKSYCGFYRDITNLFLFDNILFCFCCFYSKYMHQTSEKIDYLVLEAYGTGASASRSG